MTFKSMDFSLENNEDADQLISILNKQQQHYKSKNAQLELTIQKQNLSPDSLSFSCRKILDKITKLEEASGVYEIDAVDTKMSFLDNAAKLHYCKIESKRLKGIFEDLSERTEKIQEDVTTIEKEVNNAKSKIESLQTPCNNLEKNQRRVECYEEMLEKYINKYPWANKPEYNLLSIHEEMKKTQPLKYDLDKIKTELKHYRGLKPDRFTAKQQLVEVKNERDKIKKKINSNIHKSA